MNEKVFSVKRAITFADFVRKWISHYLGKDAIQTRQCRTHEMVVFANDFIGNQINIFGFYERDELDVVFAFLSPLREDFCDSAALDIGANIGNHAIYLNNFFDEVLCFEPNEETFEILKFNIRSYPRISAQRVALGAIAGQAVINSCPTNIGSAKLVSAQTEASGEPASHLVPVASLDEMGSKLPHVSLLKIDVEGWELKVLEGGKNFLAKHAPIVLMEQLKFEFREGETEAIRFLRKRGYTFYWIERRANRIPIPMAAKKIYEFLFGREYCLYTGAQVPASNHTMVVAVPEAQKTRLGGPRAAR